MGQRLTVGMDGGERKGELEFQNLELRKREPKKGSGSSGTKNKTTDSAAERVVGYPMRWGYLVGMVVLGQVVSALLWIVL